MKKLVTFTLAILTVLCLVGCSVPLKSTTSRKNGLDAAFQANISMTLDRLQAEGVIKRFGAGAWEVEFTSPNTLSGVKLEFSEGTTSASYKGLSFSVPQSAVPARAMMLNLIKAVDDNARLDELKGEEKDGLLNITGKLEGGEFTLIVDKNGRLSGFEMDNNKLKMIFTDLSEITDDIRPEETSAAEDATEPVSESETAHETASTAAPDAEDAAAENVSDDNNDSDNAAENNDPDTEAQDDTEVENT